MDSLNSSFACLHKRLSRRQFVNLIEARFKICFKSYHADLRAVAAELAMMSSKAHPLFKTSFSTKTAAEAKAAAAAKAGAKLPDNFICPTTHLVMDGKPLAHLCPFLLH